MASSFKETRRKNGNCPHFLARGRRHVLRGLASVHSIESTPDLIAEEFAAIEALSDGVQPPLLLDVRAWQGGGTLAWKEALGRLRGTVSAIAFLADQAAEEILGPWPSVIDQLLVPAAVFTDEAEAMAYLARERDRALPPA